MIHYDIFEKLIKPYLKKGDRMIELGDQEININEKWQSAAVESGWLGSKDFFPELDVVSIDINGEHEALPLDLSKPLRNLPEPGDVLTDFGTIEHVENLYNALKNAFNLIKISGLGMHVNPLSGGYAPDHGFHYFNKKFWLAYCEACGLDILFLDEWPCYHNTKDGWEIYVVYKKVEGSKFLKKADFDVIYKNHITKK